MLARLRCNLSLALIYWNVIRCFSVSDPKTRQVIQRKYKSQMVNRHLIILFSAKEKYKNKKKFILKNKKTYFIVEYARH